MFFHNKDQDESTALIHETINHERRTSFWNGRKKGSQDVRYIGADFWSSKRTPEHGPAYTFEWAFSTEDWLFYEGSDPEDA